MRLAASGIAAGAIASRHIATLCGFPNAIGFDMGGTSTDVSLVYEGEERVTKEWFVEYGYPICFPSIEVLTIGAGGGSFAWIDEAGSLRNGPQSAGADPGPACYGRGNDRPTNTDANLVLGRLGDELIGGAMTLDRAAAERAIQEHVAEPLGLGLVEAADAIIRVANANMADAVRLISIRRGYDPREFASSPSAAPGRCTAPRSRESCRSRRCSCRPARASPPRSAACSSTSGTTSRRCSSRTSTPSTRRRSRREFEKLEARGAASGSTAEGVPEEQMSMQRLVDMRYLGQWRSLTIPVSAPVDLDDAVGRFHAEHERELQLPPRRRAGRDLPAERARGRRDAEAASSSGTS